MMTKPVVRPNGKVYRARKAPEAIILNEDHFENPVMVLVIRTHNEQVARKLANAAYSYIAGTAPGSLGLGHHPDDPAWWRQRPNGSLDNMVWESGFPDTGVPGLLFTVGAF